MNFDHPQIGSPRLLVYRECPQGCWCATGEGARAPRCNEHGELMLPGGGPPGMFGAVDGSDHREVASLRRLGFVALFGHEQAMVWWLGRLRRLLGFAVPVDGGRWAIGHFGPDPPPHGRYYSEQEISGAIEAWES